MSVIFLQRQKKKQLFIPLLCLIQLKSCNCIKIEMQPPEMFCKKGVPKNFAKFAGKHLCQGLFFNKVAGLSPATLLKKRPWHRCFPANFANYLRTPFFTEHLRWLLLKYEKPQVCFLLYAYIFLTVYKKTDEWYNK